MWFRRLRWWRAALLVTLAVVGVVFAASWVVLRVYGPTFTRERVEALLTEALAQPVHVGSVSLSPWRLGLSLADLDVPAVSPDGPGLRAATIAVSVDIASLWRRELTVSALVTDLRFDMTVPETEGPAANIFPLPRDFAVGPLHVGIGSVRIKDGHATIRLPEGAATLELQGADVTARPVAGDLVVSGLIDAFRIDALGRREQLDRVAVDGRLSADVIAIERIEWRWREGAMQLRGEVRRPWGASSELSLRAEGDIALGALARAAGLDKRLDGKARVTAEVTGRPGMPSIAARVRIPELQVAKVTARDVLIDGSWVDRKLRVDDIEAHVDDGRVRARLEATPISGGGASVALDLRELVLPGSLKGLGPAIGIAEGRVHDGGADLDRAEVKWRGLAVSLGGRIAAGSALAVRGKAVADLLDLGRALGWGPLSGRASVSAELTGRGGAQAIEGRAEIVGLVASGHAVDPVEASFRVAASPGPVTRWNGTVESPGVRWDQVDVGNIAASLAVDATRIELIRARALARAVPVEVSGVWNWSGSGRARATCGPVALAGIAGIPPVLRLGGTGRASVDASVERGAISANALVQLDRVSAADVQLGAGRADLRLRGQAVEGELSFPARRLSLRTAGRIRTGGTLTTRLELDDLALQPLLRDLGAGAAEHVEGRVSSRAELSIVLGQPGSDRGIARVMPDGLRLFGEPWTSRGPIVLGWQGQRLTVERFRLDGPAGRLSVTGALIDPANPGLFLTLDDARLPGALAKVGPGTIHSDVLLAGGGVELRRFDARWPGLTAAASGRAGGDGAVELNGRVDADLARFGPALGVSAIAGHATLTAEAHGRGGAIEATGAVRAPRIQVGGIAPGDVEVPFRLSRSSVRIEQARARLGESRIVADGSATWKGAGALTAESLARDTQVTADVRAPVVRLQDLAPLLPAAFEGRGDLALTARAEGTPRAWHGAGSLTSPRLDLKDGPLQQLRLTFALDQTRVEVTELRVDALGIPARATANWMWAGGGSVKATLGPAPLSGLALVPAGAGLQGTGRATIDATVRSRSDVSGTAHAELDDFVVRGVTAGRGRLDVSARDGVFRADVAFPGPRLRVSGTGRMDADGTLTAEATAPGIDLGFFARALGAGAGPTGTLSARATARVPLADPRRGEGVLSIDPVRLVVAGDEWENQGPIEIRWARGKVSLATFRLSAKGGLVSGAGTLTEDGNVDAQVSAQVPLGMLRAMLPEIREIGGVLDLSVRASGTLAAPRISGDGAIHRGSLLLRARPETLRDVEARLILSSQVVQLRDATGSLGGGRLQARGDLALRDWRPGVYRVRLQAQNVAVTQVEGFSSAWDADLELSGLTREAQLEGRARLVRGTYNRDLSILSLALSKSPAPAADTGPGLRLHVRVDLDNNLVVRNRIADLRAGGVLNVEGTTARPVIFGSVESRDGHIVFRDRDWSVTSATVRFADPRRLDPYLDVSAATRIGDYDVTMQVTGPVSNVAVRFSSTPRLSQSDLLSLVAFGVTGADLRESPATVLLGEAGKLLARDVLGVDPGASGLRISTGSATNSASNELRGFPGEERSIGGPSQTTANAPGGRKERVRVEYKLFAPLYLSAEYDRDGGYGGDVILRFRFR